MKNNKSEPIPVMDYRQYRRVRRLVHECCNYIDGNCIALDDGEECVCVQSISYSLLCRWFRTAVLPQDKELETALFHRLNAKKCAVCRALFTPGSNRAKYCPECAARMKRINAANGIDHRVRVRLKPNQYCNVHSFQTILAGATAKWCSYFHHQQDYSALY